MHLYLRRWYRRPIGSDQLLKISSIHHLLCVSLWWMGNKGTKSPHIWCWWMAGFSICSCTARWHSENDTSHHPPNGQISWLLLYRRDIVFLSSTIYFIFLPLTGGKRSGLISDDRYILKKKKKINPVRVLKYLLKCPSSHDYEFQKTGPWYCFIVNDQSAPVGIRFNFDTRTQKPH